MPLDVGIDAWNLTGDRRGIGRYVREIVSRLARRQGEGLRLTLLVPERAAWFARKRYLKELEVEDLPVRHRAAGRTLDVVWYPWNGMSWVAGVTSVATLHDASLFALVSRDERATEKEQRPLRVAAALARRFITLTEFSKEELVRYLALDPQRITVIPLGVKEIFSPTRQTLAASQERPYVLFVGEPEERKGVATLMQAMALLPPALRTSIDLVIAGAGGQYAVPEAPDSIGFRNLGWVDDGALAGLYAGAALFVYPSEYEGFGLPMVEAMASGVPVIAADAPGLKEAAQDAAHYVRRGDAAELASAIASVLNDRALASDLRERGFARARSLSWDETARRTLEVLEQAVAEDASP